VPDRFVAEGLLAVFPRPPVDDGGRVLVAQAEAARPVLVEGLRAAGWEVASVVAYRTVPVVPSPEQLEAVATADAVLFTSGSTVDALVQVAGASGMAGRVVAIGPVTAEAAERHGLNVAAVASPHSLEGLVAATVEALA
jgi:uroporphyrinogen-III synthase